MNRIVYLICIVLIVTTCCMQRKVSSELLSYVDAERIGVIGHSLGGHNAMFVAAFDTRLKIVVSSAGWTEFEYYDLGQKEPEIYGGRLGPWAQDRYMPLFRDKYQLDGDKSRSTFMKTLLSLHPAGFFQIRL